MVQFEQEPFRNNKASVSIETGGETFHSEISTQRKAKTDGIGQGRANLRTKASTTEELNPLLRNRS